MIFKKKKKTKTRPPKHINCRGGLMQPKHRAAKAYQLQRQHQTNKREESPKLCNNQEVNTVKAEVSSGEDTNAEDIGTPQTKITETPLQKIQMRTKSMRIPTFYHTSPTKRAVRIKSILIAAGTRCTKRRQETT